MSKQQQVFVNGLRCFRPNDSAPSFIKANLVINKKELGEWLKTQPDEIRIEIKESREKGTWYSSVNNYVPKETNSTGGGSVNSTSPSPEYNVPYIAGAGIDDDLPF